MAEAKKLTLADILAKRQEFEDMVKAQIEADRPAALTAVQEQIKLFNFTADELGFKASAAGKTPAAPKAAAKPAAKAPAKPAAKPAAKAPAKKAPAKAAAKPAAKK